jgi:hypothetical protein
MASLTSHLIFSRQKTKKTMKKLMLCMAGTMCCAAVFAQSRSAVHGTPAKFVNNPELSQYKNRAAKGTATGDTATMSHIGSADTVTIYFTGTNADSGYIAGTDAYGDKAFAERYDVNPSDSTVKVIGVISLFGGKVNPASTKTINYNVWTMGTQTVFGSVPHVFYKGLPSTVLTSRTQPINTLGIGVADTAQDTLKGFLFATPTAYLRASFFIGYDINYTWGPSLAGDTIGLYSNQDGDRSEALYTVSGTDTIINTVNVTMTDDGMWHDNAVEQFRVFNNLYIFPIVIVGESTVGTGSVKRNDFTFEGNYPNPAVNSTNVRFSLAKPTDVTITIMDMNGRTVNTISRTNLSAGAQSIPVQTSAMPAGDYIYLIRTAQGDGVASKLTVIK